MVHPMSQLTIAAPFMAPWCDGYHNAANDVVLYLTQTNFILSDRCVSLDAPLNADRDRRAD